MGVGFNARVSDFREVNTDNVVGVLVKSIADSGLNSQYSLQINVWSQEVNLLKSCFERLSMAVPISKDWHVALEYEIPRRQKRPDVIILADNLIFVIEFKFGMRIYEASAQWQVEDYALNLRDFHAESSGRRIIPVLCVPDAIERVKPEQSLGMCIVDDVWLANEENLWNVLGEAYALGKISLKADAIDPTAWISSAYRPVLTIIEAAERLYENHGVREISHSYAQNLDKTTDMLTETIIYAKNYKKRCICFVTGVPGAGKTLTGLNVVHDPTIRSKQGPSGIFLSGNGPLVKVVREALILNQQKAGRRRKDAEHEVSTFIQNVHQFLRYHRENPSAVPHEHVVVFDEAQRAWNKQQMKRKQGVDHSEPAELIEVMERAGDWAVVIALVGGGQEIFLGEAGLEEWGRAIQGSTEKWSVIASPEVISGGPSVAGHRLFENGLPNDTEFRSEKTAHLTVSVRSHRAQQITEWVNDLLRPDAEKARYNFPEPREFPLVVTRDLNAARAWLRMRSGNDPHKRCGLVAASEDQRLRAYGLENSTDFRMGYPFEKWFLAPAEDVRSSYSLEVSASEFECQGLELDWVGMCWGGDLTFDDRTGGWDFRKFRGSKWQNCRSEVEKNYIVNRYRVLLTRARSGMVVWVPPGSKSDSTRDPARFDRIYTHLKKAGMTDLKEMVPQT